jgi:hypothetical protein
MARVDEQDNERNGWSTPDDSWLEMEAAEEDKEGIFFVNIVTEEENEGGHAGENGAREDCMCLEQPSSTEEKEEGTATGG